MTDKKDDTPKTNAPSDENDRPRGHMSGPEVLEKLYNIRDQSLNEWEKCTSEGISKGVATYQMSFEKAVDGIIRQENLNAIRGEGKGNATQWTWAPVQPDEDQCQN